MTSSEEGEKTVSVRVDADLVERVDRQILEAKADNKLPMDYSRSDAIRQFLERVAEDPSILYDD